MKWLLDWLLGLGRKNEGQTELHHDADDDDDDEDEESEWQLSLS
jgi:hypothetical protein